MRSRYSRRFWAGFELFFRPWMRRRLDGIHLRGTERLAALPHSTPVLLVANHTSWWDGFLLREIQRTARPDSPLHVVMSEAEMRRFPIFRWMGAVPLSEGPVGARSLLRDLRERIERRPDAVVGFFPQGRIGASHGPLEFRDGGAWLARRLPSIAIAPVGIHLEPLTRPAPAAFVSVGPPRPVGSTPDTAELQEMVADEVQSILALVGQSGEDAVAAWNARRAATLAAPARTLSEAVSA